jgi:hypothetical protein
MTTTPTEPRVYSDAEIDELLSRLVARRCPDEERQAIADIVHSLRARNVELEDAAKALKEAHMRLDQAGIPSAAHTVCDDPVCQSQVGHRIHALAERVSQLEAERDALGQGIAEAAIKVGIIDRTQSLTGPQLLMLCNDLAGLYGSGVKQTFVDASVAVWREIDRLSALPNGYHGLPQSTDLRKRELAAWEQYRAELDAEV